MKNLFIINILAAVLFFQMQGQNLITVPQHPQSGEWNIISEVPGEMNALHFNDSLQGWAIGDSGKIFATDDGGITWLPQYSGTSGKLWSICFLDETRGFVSGASRTLITTHDQGKTWEPIQVKSDSGSIYSSLCSDADKNLYFVSNYGEVYRSQDSGVSWQNTFNFNSWGFAYLDYSNYPVSLSMKSIDDTLYLSTDGGTVWQGLSLPSRWSGDIFFLNGDSGWVTENWGLSSSFHDSVSIHSTTNAGRTWNRQATLSGLSLDNIVFANNSEGWVSMIDKIYHTGDGGRSWDCQFESVGNGYIKDIFFFNDRNGWAVTNEGKIIGYTKSPPVSVKEFYQIHPQEYIVHQNYPNPFNPSTNIRFSVPSRSHVTVTIYNVLGKEVATLLHLEKSSGSYSVQWDASGQASGLYFYRLSIGSSIITKKMLLIR